jgi:hypothetical protein
MTNTAYLAHIRQAIASIQNAVHWKTHSAVRHLQKRKRQGHLPPGATLQDYDDLIQAVLHDDAAQVYLYWYLGTAYVAVVATIQQRPWLVMFGFNGTMESAFVIETKAYLAQPGFECLGALREVQDDKLHPVD